VIFIALHGMQTRYSDEKAVRLSVCPSVKRVNCDKTEEKSVQIFIPYERTLAQFSGKNGWWGRPLLLEILGQLAPVGAKSQF